MTERKDLYAFGFLLVPLAGAALLGGLMALLDWLSAHYEWWAEYLDNGDA